jgi:cellulose synthase operon protein B
MRVWFLLSCAVGMLVSAQAQCQGLLPMPDPTQEQLQSEADLARLAQMQLQPEARMVRVEASANSAANPATSAAATKEPIKPSTKLRTKERTKPPLKFQPTVRRTPATDAKFAVQSSQPLPVPPQQSQPDGPVAEITLADIGFSNGFRFANLGGQSELFVPLPESGDVSAIALDLVIDDISAHDAKRNLEIQVNDRAVAAIVLDGKSPGRTLRIPLDNIRARNGFLKVAFLYSGAATADRCIDVRAVGDVVTIRPESAVEIDIGPVAQLDVATTTMLMPRDVAVVLPGRPVSATEIATAITVGRAIVASGRRVAFFQGYDQVPALAKRDENQHWVRGIVLVGPLADAASVIDSPIATIAGEFRQFGLLDAVRIGGLPALLVSDSEAVRAGRLFASPMLAATRGISSASVGKTAPVDLPGDRVTFDQLGIPADVVEVFGRANLSAVIDTRRLPAGTRPTRLLLDVMVAPDGDGEKAVVSAFVNEHMLGSTVAANGEPTHLDLALAAGLVGTVADLRVVVERDSAQGNCRFEPQGYPAQILGSSAVLLEKADGAVHDFADLTPHFARGFAVLLPASAAERPAQLLGMVSQVANQLSPDTAPFDVSFTASGGVPMPNSAFIAVSDVPPADTTPHVRFDRGRVAVIDRSGHTLLDLGGFVGAAVAQVVSSGDAPGIWIHPLANDDSLPAPPQLHLDHGDVAFVDNKGVTLAMSTERDSVVKISYPDQVSWLTVAERFRSWIIAGLWLLGTAVLLLTLQRMFRRRPANSSD